MKVEKKQPDFTPVVITLESQEEVDQLFALANYNQFSSPKHRADVTTSLMALEDKIFEYHMPVGRGEGDIVTF